MAERNPESRARSNIDAQLAEAGWVAQDYARVDLSAGRGIALRETPMKSGAADYLLLVDRRAVGVIEAKKEGERLSGVAEQSGDYAENLPDFIQAAGWGRLPSGKDHPRALIQMATGSGKTFTAVSFVYRLIKQVGCLK